MQKKKFKHHKGGKNTKMMQKKKFKHQKEGKDAKGGQRNPKNRKNKLHIKFDNVDRRGYLKGFHKRKEERRKEAYEKIEKDLKEELKRIRSERREMMKKMMYNESQEEEEEEEEEENNPNTVNPNTVVTTCGSATVEISELDLTSKFGQEPSKVSQIDIKQEDDKDEENSDDEIPVYTKENLEELGILSKKDLKRSVRQSATRAIKASKLMQKKEIRHAREQRKLQRKLGTDKRKMSKKKKQKLKQRNVKPRERR